MCHYRSIRHRLTRLTLPHAEPLARPFYHAFGSPPRPPPANRSAFPHALPFAACAPRRATHPHEARAALGSPERFALSRWRINVAFSQPTAPGDYSTPRHVSLQEARKESTKKVCRSCPFPTMGMLPPSGVIQALDKGAHATTKLNC